jgi:hypothetical protein
LDITPEAVMRLRITRNDICAVGIVGVVLLCLLHVHMRGMWQLRVYNDKMMLIRAYNGFVKTGVMMNYGPGWVISPYTNVVTAGGASHRCVLAMEEPWYRGEGVLAMTTNHVFIWVSPKKGTRIVEEHYKAPLFSRRF